MTRRVVSTKNELKKAVKDEVDIIVISKTLEKELKPLVKAMKMPAKKKKVLIKFLGATGAVVVASLAAIPASGGLSSTIPIVYMAPVTAFAATSGISVPVIVGLILLAVMLGVPCLIELMRMYDIEESETTFKFGGFECRRKTKYKK